MSFRPSLPLMPSARLRALVADGLDGEPLVRWPRGESHRPAVRVALRATATDADGVDHPYRHMASVTLTGPQDLVPVATVTVHNQGEAPREVAYLDDGDGGLFAAPPPSGPGHARDVALRELEHLAARLLGPEPPAGGRVRDEAYYPAVEAGCHVLTMDEAAALPDLDGLRASGVDVRLTDASVVSARAALAIGRAYAWTGDALALPARLPHWNLSCDEAGRVRLSCRSGDPREIGAWSAAAAFPLAEGERALAAAKAVAAASGTRTVNAAGEARVAEPGLDPYDGALATAAAMARPTKALVRQAMPSLDEPAALAGQALADHPGRVGDAAAAAAWWGAWSAFSATLPDEEPEGNRDLRRLHLARLVLDASGYGGPAGAAAGTPDAAAPEPPPVAAPEDGATWEAGSGKPRRDEGELAALAASARLVLAGIEFSVLAQSEAVQDQGRLADVVRDAAAVAADLMPYLAHGGDAYRGAWEEVLQAGIALRARPGADALSRLSRALAALWDVDPEIFPDPPAAARWAMDLRPRQRAATRACAALAAERAALETREAAPAEPPVADAPAQRPDIAAPAVTVRRAAPPPRAPGRGRPGVPPRAFQAAPRSGDGPDDAAEPVAAPSPAVTRPPEEAAALPAVPGPAQGVEESQAIPGGSPGMDDAPPAAVPPAQSEPPDAPAEPEPESDPASPADPLGKAAPTRNGMRVVEAMRGRPPMRKVDIAVLAGIGRGAANRTVERLVADGWMVPDGHNLFRLAG